MADNHLSAAARHRLPQRSMCACGTGAAGGALNARGAGRWHSAVRQGHGRSVRSTPVPSCPGAGDYRMKPFIASLFALGLAAGSTTAHAQSRYDRPYDDGYSEYRDGAQGEAYVDEARVIRVDPVLEDGTADARVRHRQCQYPLLQCARIGLERILGRRLLGRQPFAQPHDAAEGIDDDEVLARRTRDQQPAVVGAEVDRRIGLPMVEALLRGIVPTLDAMLEPVFRQPRACRRCFAQGRVGQAPRIVVPLRRVLAGLRMPGLRMPFRHDHHTLLLLPAGPGGHLPPMLDTRRRNGKGAA